MYKGDHYIFSLPDENQIQTVWRYIDFWKFKDLLESSELYLASIQKMGDEHEAEVPEVLRKGFVEYARETKGEDYAEGLKKVLEPSLSTKKTTYLSSWNNQENESFALWKLYTSDRSAIAINSNIDRLKDTFRNETTHTQYIGQILYHDGINYSFRGNLFDPVMHKWNYYEFEKEIRVVTSFPAASIFALDTHPEGIRLKVDLDILLDSIYLAPNATEAEFIKVKELLDGKGLQKEIFRSGIRDRWSNT